MEEQATKTRARTKEARHAAKALLRTAGISNPPVQVSVLLKYVPKNFNLMIRGTKDRLGNGVDAFTYKEMGLTIIGYNQNTAIVRQKFSVAHELGHLYMGHLHGQSSIDLNSKNFDEIEANQFAAQLIMPLHFLRQDIKTGLKDINNLAKRYVVSEEALWWQITNFSLLNLL